MLSFLYIKRTGFVSKICTKGRVTFFLSLSFILILYRNFGKISNFNRSKEWKRILKWPGTAGFLRTGRPAEILRIEGKKGYMIDV